MTHARVGEPGAIDRPVHIVTCDAPRLVAALRLARGERSRVRVTALATIQAVIEGALELRPDIVILPAGEVSPRAERVIARGLRARLPRTQILLALPPNRYAVDEDLTLYDGLVALDDPERDVHMALAPLLARPERRAPRVAVPLPAEVTPPDGAAMDAMAVDVSDGGAGLLLPLERPAPEAATIRFHRDDGRSVTLAAQRAWSAPLPGGTNRMGVRFVSATLDGLRALRDLAFWRIAPGPDGEVIHLCGELGEATSFTHLAVAAARVPRLDLAGVSYATAPGLLRWYDFVRGLPPGVELRLRRVSQTVAGWLAALPRTSQCCFIESVYATGTCAACGFELETLVDPRASPEFESCPACGGDLLPAGWSGARRPPRAAQG